MAAMKKQYGPNKAERVFYATKNAGKLKNVEHGRDRMTRRKKQ